MIVFHKLFCCFVIFYEVNEYYVCRRVRYRSSDKMSGEL